MKVELLYFDGCPSYESLLPRLEGLLARHGVEEDVQLRRVESSAAAVRERFLGSPTVRVDGEDVEQGAAERCEFGLQCRLYATGEGLAHLPPDDQIEAALERAGS